MQTQSHASLKQLNEKCELRMVVVAIVEPMQSV